MTPRREMIRLDDVAKTFVMHLRGGARLPVVTGVSFAVAAGECVVLGGPSGTGKSSVLKMIYGNYRTDSGRIMVREGKVVWDIAQATPRRILCLRQTTVAYVSQFLRVIPRVPALEVVAAAGRARAGAPEEARDKAAELLRPFYELLKSEILQSRVIHTDDTPVKVLDRNLPQTRTGRFWVYCGDRRHHYTAYDYTPSRQRDGPVRFLGDYAGYLAADAFAGYDGIYAGGQVTQVLCWAHARRKFFDLHAANGSPVAAEALARIGELYAIEDEIRGKPPDERREVRQARAGPALDALHAWLHEQLAKVAKKSEFALAIRYTLSRWTALTRYRDDGRVEIDNNAAERSLRAIALGRKNWLFAGCDDGGERAAAIYSLLGTAQLNGLNIEAYLRHLFERLPEHPINRIEELLPWAIAGELPQLKLAA